MNGNADGRGILYIKKWDFIYRHRAWYYRTERDGRLWLRPIRFYESERRNFLGTLLVKVVYLSGYSKNQTVAFWLFLQDPWTI